MKYSTPSEKIHAEINPLPVNRQSPVSRNKTLIVFKFLFGTPIPYLFVIMASVILLPRILIGITLTLLATLIIGYIAVDRFSQFREFRFFRLGFDIPLIGFVLVICTGLMVNEQPLESFYNLAHLYWVPLIYIFTYGFSLFPGINRLFKTLIIMTSLVAGVTFLSTLIGYSPLGTSLENSPIAGLFINSGFNESRAAFSHTLAIILCFPLATLFYRGFSIGRFYLAAGLATIIIASALFSTHLAAAWIAGLAGALTSLFLFNRRLTVLALTATGITFYFFQHLPEVHYVFQWLQESTDISTETRRGLLSIAYAIFEDHRWLGAGYGQLDQFISLYAENMGLSALAQATHIPNLYFELLASAGTLGLMTYMIFIASALLMAARLFQEIPRTHFWHQVIILGCLASQVSFHTSSLFMSTSHCLPLITVFVLSLAIVCYFSEAYSRGVVPDDQAL